MSDLILRVAGLVTAEAALEDLLSDPTDVELYGLQWSSQRSRAYRKGQRVEVLDLTGYHDAILEVVSDRIIVDDDNQKYLACKQVGGGSGVHVEELNRAGYLKGDVEA